MLPARAARRRPNGSVNLSGCFEFGLLAEKLDCLSQDRGAETEGALDDAGLASDVTGDIEGPMPVLCGARASLRSL